CPAARRARGLGRRRGPGPGWVSDGSAPSATTSAWCPSGGAWPSGPAPAGHGEARDPLAATERSEALGALALHGDGRADGLGEPALHLVAVRGERGRLEEDRAVDVARRPPGP